MLLLLRRPPQTDFCFSQNIGKAVDTIALVSMFIVKGVVGIIIALAHLVWSVLCFWCYRLIGRIVCSFVELGDDAVDLELIKEFSGEERPA